MQILAAPFLSAVAGDFESIATTVVGVGGQATVTFSSIPGTYKHLQIRYAASTSRATFVDNLVMKINSDTGSNYATHKLYGDGTSAYSDAATSQTQFEGFSQNLAGAAQTNVVGVGVIDILDYANTNKYKTFKALNGLNLNTADGSGSYGRLQLNSGVWMSSSAITTISFNPYLGANFQQYSHFALYGIKG